MATEIAVTVPEVVLSTYRVLPFGVIASKEGVRGTSIAAPALPVATEIGVTQPLLRLKFALATYSVFPSGVIAMAVGWGTTVIGRPAFPVAVEIGCTSPAVSPPATYTVRPSGVLVIKLAIPVAIRRPTAPVRTEIGVTAPPAGLPEISEVTYRVGGIAAADAGAGRDPV